MKLKPLSLCAASAASLALAFVATPALSQTPSMAHQAAVEERSKEVMPFDLNRTMHIFEPTAYGGVQTIVVHGDPNQIALVRSHLQKEAAAFARGDFTDPADIHGNRRQHPLQDSRPGNDRCDP